MPRMALLILIMLVGCKAPQPKWQATLDGAVDGNGQESFTFHVTIGE
jgi:hypothetical protein